MNAMFDAIRAAMPGPEARFIETGDGRIFTYGDVLALSGAIAGALGACGVKPGDRVAVQADKSPEMLMLYLACLRSGAVFLPLNPAYMIPELEYFFADAGPALVVCTPARQAEIARIVSAGTRVETLDESGEGSLLALAAETRGEWSDVARGADDLAAILYTSGTTGRSKGAMLTHGNLLSNAVALVDTWRFTPSDVLIHALPIFHTHGLFVGTNVTLLAGASMLFFNRFDPAEIIAAMQRATAMMGVPTFYVRLLQHPGLTRQATAGIRVFISGSAPLLAETFNAWHDITGHRILERYGMTETNMITSNPYDGERIAATVGRPLPGVEVRIAAVEGGALPAEGEIGMIEVRGPNVFSGYWRMPEKTEAEFRADGFFITGDLGTIDGRGYLRIVGRGKDLVISGGFNVYPREVEDEIDAVPGVAESAVIGVAHRDFGEGVTAVVVRATGSTLDEAAVIAAIGGRLARYKQPKRVLFVDELPRNSMGKVQKNLLRERFKGLYEGPPRSSA